MNNNKTKSNEKVKKPKLKYRFLVVAFTISMAFFLIIIRLGYIMIGMGPKYKAIADDQQKSEIKINPKRGSILDRNGNELAVSAGVYEIDLDLKTLRQTLNSENISADDLAAKLGSILNMKPKEITKIFNSTLKNGLPASSATLKRQVEKSEVDKVKALNVRGIVISPDTKRFYPNGNFLSSVLGTLNSEGIGVSGVEQAYNKEMMGIPGRNSYEKDVKSNQLPYEDSQYVKPVDGKNVVLSIDETIQEYAETAAEKALKDNNAKSVSVIVMNPKNGEVLAMTSKPDFDPNNPYAGSKNSKDTAALWQNRSVQNTFEPGSIFKVITSACAIENNIGVNDAYTCNGSIKVNKVPINCWDLNGHGTESFGDIIKNSCNVGFVELGSKLGKDKLIPFIQRMGFGQKTGIDLPGEAAGILRDQSKINNVDLATIAFGQGLGVTQVQYMAAFNAVANGGTWIRPHVMKQITHADENSKTIVDKEYSNYGKKTVYNAGEAATLRQYLVKVVTEGVGKKAFVKDLDIAGKTGTAQIADPKTGTYAAGKYMSSFAGMAPSTDPKITMLVSVEEPGASNYYASEVAAPVAKDLFTEIFNYLAIKGDLK